MIRANLAGHSALVTGSASGIGLATATLLARCGAEVILFLLAGAAYMTGETVVVDGGLRAGRT